MKKILAIIGIFVLTLTLTGCGKEKTSSIDLNGDLSKIMEALYSNIKEDELPMYLENMEVNDENIESFIGTKNVKYEDIIASESMVTSTAHSVVLIRTSEDEDVDKVMKDIKENVNPRKWICVGIEKDEVIVKNKGNLILVVIVEDEVNRSKIEKEFDNL